MVIFNMAEYGNKEGNSIVRQLLAMGVSQYRIAKDLPISREQVKKWLRGYSSPNTDLFRKSLVSMVCGVFFLLGAVTPSYGSSTVDLSAISFIESSNNPLAFNKLDHGGLGSRGLFQVSESLRKDFNLKNKTSFSKNDLFNPEINRRIADWYLHEEIPRLLKHFNKKATLENVLTAYNMGIGAVLKGKTATSYVVKYRRFSRV